jgi:undecaprenyl-diphosphatase
VDLLMAVILGIVQGVTEFLPVSSTAHLRIVPTLMGRPDPGAAFTAVIQLGSVAAILLFFAKDLWRALLGWSRSLFDRSQRQTVDARMGWAIFWGSIPIVVLGFLFKDQIKSEQVRSLYVISGALIGMGVLMLISERMGRKERKQENVTVKDGILIGTWQCLSLIPGMSRSGSTITGALFAGFDRQAAARVSFLLSVPSIAGAGFYQLYDERRAILGESLTPVIVCTLVTFVVSYWAIGFLIRFIQRRGVAVFVGYRIALGFLLLLFVQLGTLEPYQTPAEPEVVQPTPEQQARERLERWESAMQEATASPAGNL